MFRNLAIAGFLIAGISGSLLLVSARHGEFPSQPSTPSVPVKTDRRLEVETVTITPDGFEPQEIVRPAGPFLLSVTNRSGVDSLNIQLETETHGRLREKSLPLETPHWREVINPPPGRYVITEPNHPEWTFSLIIQ